MPERRMISRDIFDSSVAWTLGTTLKGYDGLKAQRVFETLILLADDYGNGKLIPELIRKKAFGSIPDVEKDVTSDDIIYWIRLIEEKEKAVLIYEVEGQKYYTLTGWQHYQRGNWRPTDSNIPKPPDDLINKSNVSNPKVFDSLRDEEKKNIREGNKESDISEKTICRTSFPSDSKFYAAVKTLFPEIKDEKAIQKQAAVLDEIERHDRMPLEGLLPILKWAKQDEFWKSVFLSCGKLRCKNDGVTMKWQSIKAAYDRERSKESDDSSTEPEPEEWKCPKCGITQRKYQSNPTCQYCRSENQND